MPGIDRGIAPRSLRSPRNAVAGGLMALLGAAAVLEARGFGLGTAARMGPGFYPAVVGAALALVGLLIAAVPEALPEAPPGSPPETVPGADGPGDGHAGGVRAADWRGRGCIAAGVALFAAVGERFGLGPATFACVFVAALGDRRSRPLPSLALAAGATAMAGVVFTLLLKFQLPFVRW